jgi:hypothetical protein
VKPTGLIQMTATIMMRLTNHVVHFLEVLSRGTAGVVSDLWHKHPVVVVTYVGANLLVFDEKRNRLFHLESGFFFSEHISC